MDAAVLEDVLGYIHNWFVRDTYEVSGCTIAGGTLPMDIPNGVWFRIQGSYLNDGMHVGGDADLTDETFDGTVTTHVVPAPLIALCEEIEEWKATYGAASSSPYQSESFGGYSYSKGSNGSVNSAGTPSSGWQSAFAGRFTKWRKLS